MATIKNNNTNGKPTAAEQKIIDDRRASEAKRQQEIKEENERLAEADRLEEERELAQLDEKEQAGLQEIYKSVEQAPATDPAALAPETEFTDEPRNFAELSIGDRIEKIEYVSSLIEKLSKLRETKNDLAKFVLSSDKSGDTLKIQDRQGNRFETSRNHILVEVLAIIKKRVDEMIKATEAAIIL